MPLNLFDMLTNDAGVAALVGQRVYGHARAPEGVTRPYITFQTIGGHVENYIAHAPGIDDRRMQINCMATTEVQARDLKDAVVAALQPHGYQVGIELDDYEPEGELFYWIIEFEFWSAR